MTKRRVLFSGTGQNWRKATITVSEGIGFASELKAIRKSGLFEANVDIDALALFFRHNYVPSPFSIYKDIKKLPPGTWVRLEEGCTRSGTGIWTIRSYLQRKEIVLKVMMNFSTN